MSTRTKYPLKALSLFSGAGGFDLGVSRAGFEILACIELDPHCCETLRAAITSENRKTIVVEGDIRKVDPVKLMEDLNLSSGRLDLLFGGSPCQAFSQIGKRGCLDDERGMLLFEVIRFAEVFQPRVIIIEQVKGLLNAPDPTGNIGGVFEKLLTSLQNLNYIPKWKTINAADYGVPQLRQRVFIVATKGFNGFEFPQPTHGKKEQAMSLFPLPAYTTVGEVIAGLGKPKANNGQRPDDNHIDITPDGDKRRIHGVPEGSHLAKELHLPVTQRCNLTKKDTTKFRRLSRFEPSLTLRCGEIFFHPTEDRYLTPREYMRIHGYPDLYLLKGPIRSRSGRVRDLDQHRQVANSVPPRIAYVLAEQIKRILECQNFSKSSVIQHLITPQKQKKTVKKPIAHL